MRITKKYKNLLFVIAAIILVISFVYIFSPSRSANEQSDYKVNENSELIYYIDVMYDGKSAVTNEEMSSDTVVNSVISDYIYVEDKLPEGLIYQGAVETDDCTYGAVKRNDSTVGCSGYVVGAKRENGQCVGINYDDDTRVISFIVKGLQAGCKLTVGIVTETESLGNRDRVDIYNTAYAWEEKFTAQSNQMHVFMGDENASTFYSVSYQYNLTDQELEDDDVAPALPPAEAHTPGSTVGLAKEPVLEGYEFSGWEPVTSGVTVAADGTFTLPSNNVVFEGYFTPKEKYMVIYETSMDLSETGYLPPDTKSYGVGETVIVDDVSFDEDDIVVFDGWESEDVDISEGYFQMPDHDVLITGTFNIRTFELSYDYKGTLPPDYEDSLPLPEEYMPGEEVTLSDPLPIQGYDFLGWYQDDPFTMPWQDVVVYGEWVEERYTFEPEINITSPTGRWSFEPNQPITFEIVIKNNEEFDLYNVLVNVALEGCTIGESEDYYITGANNNYVNINHIEAGEEAVVTLTYTGTLESGEHFKRLVNKASIISAEADSEYEGYFLNNLNEIADIKMFYISEINLEINTVDTEDPSITLDDAVYTLYSDEDLENAVDSNVTSFSSLAPGVTYYLQQTYVTTGYQAIATPAIVTINATTGRVSVDSFPSTQSNMTTTVTINNDIMSILPYTGGVGNIPFIIGGLVIIIGSFCGYIIYRKKKEKQRKEKRGEEI